MGSNTICDWHPSVHSLGEDICVQGSSRSGCVAGGGEIEGNASNKEKSLSCSFPLSNDWNTQVRQGIEV